MENQIKLRKFLMLVTVCSVFLLQGCSDEIDYRQTKEVRGLVYKINHEDPFTGKVTGAPMVSLELSIISGNCEIEYEKGVADGMFICKFKNGAVGYKVKMVNGKKDGLEELYDQETQNIQAKINWQEGIKHGKEEWFNPKIDKLNYLVTWNQGRKEGKEQRWDESGDHLITDLTWQNNVKTGLERESLAPINSVWEDKMPAPQTIVNYRNGKWHGQRKSFTWFQMEDGTWKERVSRISNYKDGKEDGASQEFDGKGNIKTESTYKNGICLSRLTQSWDETNNLLSKVYMVHSPSDDDPTSDRLVKDGVQMERSTIYMNSGDEYDQLHEVEWRRGVPLKGKIITKHKGNIISTLGGVPDLDDNSRLVKNGVDYRWDMDGNVISAIKWEKGIITAPSEAIGRDSEFERYFPIRN